MTDQSVRADWPLSRYLVELLAPVLLLAAIAGAAYGLNLLRGSF